MIFRCLLRICFLKHVSQANIVSFGIHVIAYVWCQPMWFVSNCCSGIISGWGQNPWQWWRILGCALQGENDAKIKFLFSKVPVATISQINPLSARQTSQMSQHMQLFSLNDKRHNIIISINDKRQRVFYKRTTNVSMSQCSELWWRIFVLYMYYNY